MKKALIVISCLLLLGYAADCRADIVNLNLGFTAPDQSLWGGGGISAGFREQGSTGGSIGVSWDVGANTGTVSGNFNGGLSIDHVASMAAPGYTPITMNFAGASNGGVMQSDLGAWVNIGWFANVNMPWFLPDIHARGSIFSQEYGLNIYETFTPSIGGSVSGNDSFAAYSLEAGVSPIAVGLDFLVTETNTFRADDITGQLRYQLSGASDYGITDFTIDSGGVLTTGVDLNTSGTWNFSLANLTLNNYFAASFGLGLSPYIDYVVGTYSPGSISVDLFHLTPFELAFNDLNYLNAFSIDVEQGTPVPEPSTMLLLGSGLIGLAGYGRKKLFKK